MTDYLFWLDFETTGLDLYDTTVLEAAWTLTGPDLVQVTPLKRSFTAIRVGKEAAAEVLFGPSFASGWSKVQQRVGNDRPVIPLALDHMAERGHLQPWSDRLPQVVAEMHQKSGLHAEWLDTPAAGILTAPEELDAELMADLAQAGFHPDEDSVAIAGAGVGHFDLPLLRNLRLATADLLHYRPADVSSSISVLGIKPPKTNDALFQLLRRVCDLPEEAEALLALDVDDSVTDLQVFPQEGVGDCVSLHSLTGHRAASDVAFSLVLARILRYVVAKVF